MGYYTNYCFEVKVSSVEKIKEIIKKFNEILGWEELDLNNITDDGIIADFELKWYEHDEDMKKLSSLFPEYAFYLEGQGEDREDWWKAIFKNGVEKISYAELVPPQFPNIEN